MPTTSVDTALVRASAARIDAAADLLQELVGRLRGLRFEGGVAGADAVSAAIRRTVADAARWAQATRELADALRAGADAHAGADSRAAGSMR